MIDNAERNIIRDAVQAMIDSVPPGPERAAVAKRLGPTIKAMNSAEADKDVGDSQLEMLGYKVRR